MPSASWVGVELHQVMFSRSSASREVCLTTRFPLQRGSLPSSPHKGDGTDDRYIVGGGELEVVGLTRKSADGEAGFN